MNKKILISIEIIINNFKRRRMSECYELAVDSDYKALWYERDKHA